MQISREDNGALDAIITINLKPEDYKEPVDASLKSYRKKADMKGFRKGMVPMGIVKKMYGNAVLYEEINKILSENLEKYLTDGEIKILGQPMPLMDEKVSLDINDEKDYTFSYEIGLEPKIEVKLDAKTKANSFKIKVDKKLLDEEIVRLQSRYGNVINPEKAAADDVLNVEFHELDGKELKEGGVKYVTALPVDMFSDKKIQKKVVGIAPNSDVDLNIFEAFDKERKDILKQFLGLEEGQEPENMGDEYRMMVKTISRTEPANIDQEFFDKIFGKDVITEEKAFRARLTEDYEKFLSAEADKKFNIDMVDMLIEKTDIELPEAFLKKWIKTSNEKPISDEQVESDFPSFSRSLRWSLILNKLAEDHEVKIEFEDIKAQTLENLRGQFNLGAEVPEEMMVQLNQYADHLLKDKEHIRQTIDYLLEKKVFDKIKDTVKLQEKEISWDEFKKLNDLK